MTVAATSTPKRYVVGFLIDRERCHVCLIRKNRPEWQAGKVNGVGGKIEGDETPWEAMTREFEEETGMFTDPRDWQHMVTIKWFGDAEPSSVSFFRCHWTRDEFPPVKSMTDEQIFMRHVEAIATSDDMIPNLHWLLPLALYTADRYEAFTLWAEVAEAVS